MTNNVEHADGIDVDRLRRWLAATVDPSITQVAASRLGGGNSSGAWRLDLSASTGPRSLVLKAPNDGGLVFDCNAAPAHLVPRQLAVIDWLTAHVPADADAEPALCMGDSRLGNALLQGTEVRALVDFEVAYIGNPAADIGYCLMHEAFTRLLTDRPATGVPSVAETWDYWETITGRSVHQRDYWTAFGATVLCVTGTRAMLKWGMPVATIDNDNIVVAEWEALIERATNC